MHTQNAQPTHHIHTLQTSTDNCIWNTKQSCKTTSSNTQYTVSQSLWWKKTLKLESRNVKCVDVIISKKTHGTMKIWQEHVTIWFNPRTVAQNPELIFTLIFALVYHSQSFVYPRTQSKPCLNYLLHCQYDLVTLSVWPCYTVSMTFFSFSMKQTLTMWCGVAATVSQDSAASSTSYMCFMHSHTF